MVSSLPPPFQRAKEALRLARVDQSRDFQAQDLAMEAMEVTDIVEKLQLAQDALEFYPFCADAWGVVGNHYLNEEKNLEASIEAYETGVEAARRVYPKLSPERTDNISWSNYDYGPYVRVIIGLAQAYFESGHIDATFETAELLTRRGYAFLNLKLSGWYIQTARWEDARRILRRSDHQNCGIVYNEVLVFHHFFEAGGRNEKSSKKLYKALGRALRINIHVPSHLVLDVVKQHTRPEYVSHGGKDEALRYAIDSSKLWQTAFGALQWLLSVKGRYGPKPNEEVLVRWIRKRLVYVEFLNRPGERITQNLDKMTGSATDDFQMRPECHQPHTIGSVICAQKRDFGAMPSENWITFSYKEVVSVPYWSILAPIYEAEDEETH